MIPRTPKRFANWRAKQPQMPVHLLQLADRARRAIDTLTAHKNSADLSAIRLQFMLGSFSVRGSTHSLGKVAVKVRGH